MATYRFNPPLQLRNDPSWTIVSLDEVAEPLAAHALALAHADGEAAGFGNQIRHCAAPEAAANLGSTLRDWAIRKRLVAAPLH
jgi:hypothetical protein